MSNSAQKSKLEKQYKQLMEKAYKMSHKDRKASDALMAEADAIGRQLDAMNKA